MRFFRLKLKKQKGFWRCIVTWWHRKRIQRYLDVVEGLVEEQMLEDYGCENPDDLPEAILPTASLEELVIFGSTEIFRPGK